MPQLRINNRFGKLTGWNDMEINFAGRVLQGITGVSYGHSQQTTNEYGAGGDPIGYAVGNYTTDTCVLELYMEEWTAFLDALGKGKRAFDVPAFDIPVTYDWQGKVYKDIVRNFKPMQSGKPWRQGDGKLMINVTGNCTEVVENAA